jgi:hypothetical protein
VVELISTVLLVSVALLIAGYAGLIAYRLYHDEG